LWQNSLKIIDLNCALNIAGSINTTTQVKTTVNPLINIEKVIMKKGRSLT
tara:strand:+ start:310 stop:459 length:150 start_codon:yes stop_codon:yes gene_type:complete